MLSVTFLAVLTGDGLAYPSHLLKMRLPHPSRVFCGRVGSRHEHDTSAFSSARCPLQLLHNRRCIGPSDPAFCVFGFFGLAVMTLSYAQSCADDVFLQEHM